MTRRVETWQLRAKFAAALSRLYGAEVPAYTTLVEVSGEVNRDCATARPDSERLGSLDRVTAERHGAIRVGSARELADVADLFAALGMYPVGFYDLRDAASPVVSTAFRPIDTDQLARNPFRVFTSMLATADARFFSPELRDRVVRFIGARRLFDLPTTDKEMAASGLAYYHGGDPSKPVVYEDFLPGSAAGIFRSNLDTDTQAAEATDNSDYSLDWLAGQIGHHVHDPYELYEKVASS